MSKTAFTKPGNFIYPVPAVLVSCRGADGAFNIVTVAWTGTVCSDPPMAYISLRPSRHSYDMIRETGEFVINLPNENLVHALDYCGCTSGSRIDKFSACRLTPDDGVKVAAPSIAEAPVSIECKVTQVLPLGSHDLFLAEVLAVRVDDQYLDERGAFHMDQAGLVSYEHGVYRAAGKKLGTFGFSVRKKAHKRRKR